MVLVISLFPGELIGEKNGR